MIKRNFWLVLVVLMIIAGGLFLVFQRSGISNDGPNVVFIYADDMDMKLLPYMPKTNELIGAQGAVFSNFFVTASACCPSRASILCGQYPHNTNILENSPGFEKFNELGKENETLATWMDDAGYRTSYMGKYLNLYPAGVKRTYIPPGWDDWHVFLYGPTEQFYYAYAMNENGRLVKYGKHDYEYSTDVLRDKAVEFIDESSQRNAPFFLMVSVFAPHGPTFPAPQYVDSYTGLEYPQGASFQEEDISDKPAIVRELIQTSGVFEVADANELFVKRIQTMQSVDDLVADLVKKLEESGELDNTYFFFTSDNGFHMGEHQLSSGKMLPYEEDIHVPLLVRGPGIVPGTKVDEMVANIDLAPTIAELTQSKPADSVDGRSFVSFLKSVENNNDWRNALLLEAGDLDRNSPVIAFRGFRTEKFKYVEYESGELEFYDLVNDPYEMQNIASTLSADTLSTLHSWLEQLKSCKSDECHKAEILPLDQFEFQP